MRAAGPGQFPHLLLDVLEQLASAGLPCAVAGALATSLHGVPRGTADADAVVWLHGSGLTPETLAARLRSAGLQASLSEGDPADPIAARIDIRDPYQNRVDLLIGIRGMDPEAARRTVTAPLLDTPVRFLGAEDLIAMKLFAGGGRDVEDVRGILQVSGPKLDLELLRRLVRR
ncbi:MAG: hypothetical protein ACK44W_07610, partial [Planctomycetota bacterium]